MSRGRQLEAYQARTGAGSSFRNMGKVARQRVQYGVVAGVAHELHLIVRADFHCGMFFMSVISGRCAALTAPAFSFAGTDRG
jgi:hypothetical protein